MNNPSQNVNWSLFIQFLFPLRYIYSWNSPLMCLLSVAFCFQTSVWKRNDMNFDGTLLWIEQRVRLKTVSRHTGKTNNVSCRQFFYTFSEGSSMEKLQRRVDRRCQNVTVPCVRPASFIVYFVFIVFEFFLFLFYLYQS